MSIDHRADEAWLSDLFGQHSAAVLSYARRRLDSIEDCEDLVVEVFATAWRRRADVPEDPLPWLYRTAANVVAHARRSHARRTALGVRLASVRQLRPADPAEAVVPAMDARAAVAEALRDLAESDAELIRLWAWEQLEPAQIAVVVGCTPGTARTRLHRARTRLREALVQRGVAGGTQPGAVRSPDPTAPDAGRASHPHLPTGSEDPR